jgi:hypothetical protein
MISVADKKMDLEVAAIRKGQLATFEVEGGFVRRPAPCDGLLIETRSTTIFLPLSKIQKAVSALRIRQEKAVATETAAPKTVAQGDDIDR